MTTNSPASPLEVEYIDVVDSDDKVIGVMPKTHAIASNQTCRVVFVLLINDDRKVFLQQRKSTKKSLPLYWSGSAAGHVRAGESYIDAANRELYEELGVSAELQLTEKFYSAEYNEMVSVFIAKHNGPFTLEEAAIETASFYTYESLQSPSPEMKISSYLGRVIPVLKTLLNK